MPPREANRLAPRDWSHVLLSRAYWVMFLLLNASMVFLFQRSGQIPRLTLVSAITVILILCMNILVFRWSLRFTYGEAPLFKSNRLMDYLSTVTIAIFSVCATLLVTDPVRLRTSNVNSTATQIVFIWTFGLAIVTYVYRAYSKKPISV